MTRLTIALAVCLGVASLAPASLAPHRERTLAPQLPAGRAPRLSTDLAAPGTGSEFQVTDGTEILLDGQACRYEDVPEHATILRMEVAPDGKTVLRIYFRRTK
jgi:hypothetical protein